MLKIKRDLTNYPEKDDSAKEKNKQGKNRQFTMNYKKHIVVHFCLRTVL